jgi:hypothetical protein
VHRKRRRLRQFQCSATIIYRLITHPAYPWGVSAAVTEAGLVTHENPAGTELVPVRAATRRVGNPLPGCGLYQLAQHAWELTTDQARLSLHR